MSETENQIINALIEERRRERIWRNFRFFVWIFIFLTLILLMFTPKTSPMTDKNPYVSLVQLNGTIMPGSNFSANRVIPLLNKAFADKKARGVVLLINSPGGSAVQASIIHDKILQLKAKYKKKVIVLGEDSLASGAYLIATAADKIYVNDSTLTGSIGVIFSSFGLNDAMQKLGVSRRVITAGVNKNRLDPFEPENPGDVNKLKQVLDRVHQNFINDVLQGREDKLHGDKQALFSGDFWTGQEAVQLGLVDGTDNLWNILKNDFDVQYYKDYSLKPTLIESIFKNVDTELHLGIDNATVGSINEIMSQT